MVKYYCGWLTRAFLFCVLEFTILFTYQDVYSQMCPPRIYSCTVNPRVKRINANISPRIQSYMEYLPLNYHPDSAAKYPLLIYWAGFCEIVPNPGVGVQALCNLLDVSMPKIIDEGMFPDTVMHDGQPYSYIVIAPLMNTIIGIDNVFEANAVIDYLINNYRIDTRRIYATGISFGSYLLMQHATSSIENGQKLAAISPHANCFPDTISSFSSRLANIVDANVHLWGIHCNTDNSCDEEWIQGWVNGMNDAQPGLAKYTPVLQCPPGAHPVFVFSYDTSFRVDGKNVYEWLIQYQSDYVAYRQIISKNLGGAWDDPATWSCNCIPQFDDEVTIKTGATVDITPAMGPITIRKLVQEVGSTLNVTGSLTINPN